MNIFSKRINRTMAILLTVLGLSAGFKDSRALSNNGSSRLVMNDISVSGDTIPSTSNEEQNAEAEAPATEVEAPVIEEKTLGEETILESSNEEVLELTDGTEIILMSIAVSTNPTNTLNYTPATSDNVLEDASNWNGFVLGDITDCIDFEGSIAVAGDINSNRGLSVGAGINGGSPSNTDDISLLVGGNLNLNCYGNVWGQTAASSTNNNTYNLSNVTSSGTTNQQYLVVDSNQYFTDAATTLKQANSNIASKQSNTSYTNNGYGSYDFEANTTVTELIYDVPESDFNCFNLNFNLSDGQTAVVNLTSSQSISLLNGSFSINGNSNSTNLRENASRITFNIVNSLSLSMTSCEFMGHY